MDYELLRGLPASLTLCVDMDAPGAAKIDAALGLRVGSTWAAMRDRRDLWSVSSGMDRTIARPRVFDEAGAAAVAKIAERHSLGRASIGADGRVAIVGDGHRAFWRAYIGLIRRRALALRPEMAVAA